MGDSVHGSGLLFGDEGSLESVTGVAGPVLLAATVPDLSRGDVLAGRYQIEAVIGSGGSGRVLRAFDRVTRSPVALKILRSEFAADPVWTERFSRELRVGRQIQHPNVCRVYDIGEADGHRFLSMELATGGTLRTQLEPGSMPRSVDDRIADARAIIQGVAALHVAGIVHRDLKPENILRTADGRLLVSDFGLATDPGSGPATTVMIGTPRYMAPEVVMGDPATTRSDVWALGVVMHEILSGERPDRSLIKRKRRIYTPPEVGSIRERRLVELCARCSEEDPEDRPASAVELRREFEAAAAGRRFGNRALTKQVAWAVVAVVALGSLGLIRNRWTSNAVASSSMAAGSVAERVLQPQGRPAEWGGGSKELASLPGTIHCFSLIDSGRKARIVWGQPPRVDEWEVRSGKTLRTNLRSETYGDGCPQLSPEGRRLLFERVDATGSHIHLSASPDGRDAKPLVRGTSPVWLPNGQEFAFLLDARHAGMFSIPTGQMTVIGDQVSGARQISGVAVDGTGSHLALRYFSETHGSLVTVYSIPSFDLVGSFSTPPAFAPLQFSPSGKEILFALDGDRGHMDLVALDWHARSFRNVGTVTGMDVRGLLTSADAQLVVARELKNDLWLQRPNGLTRLTFDGESDNGSVSRFGDVLVQQHQPDGRYLVVLKRKDRQDTITTSGPLDETPSFLPDGKEWIYASVDTRSIKRCRLSDGSCSVVVSDPLAPAWPAAAPSGDRIAYVTMLNQPRIRLVEMGQGSPPPRDLGPASGACPPFWTSVNRLWIAGPGGASPTSWSEIDTQSGSPTGRTEDLERTINPGPNFTCRIPATLLERSGVNHTVRGTEERSVVLRNDRTFL